MASAKKFPASQFWYACFKVPTGQVDARGRAGFRRVQRSTGLTDKTRAEQLATTYERAALQAAEKRWTEQSARQFLQEVNVLAGVQVAEMEPTETFVLRWLAGKKHTVADRSYLNFRGITADFLEYLGSRKTAPLLEVTPRIVAGFRDAELSAGKAATTVNKALSILGQIFEEAVTTQVMMVNPARGLRIKGAVRKAQHRLAFTFDQFRALVKATAPDVESKRGNLVHADWQTFVMVAGYTGGRQQEVAQLEWQNVKFDEHTIGLRRTKNGDVHWMPMHVALEKFLRRLYAIADGAKEGSYVMQHIAALGERKISRHFRETILLRIGISQPYENRAETNGKGAGRKLAEYSVHSLRHSLSTWLNDAGVPEMMRMRLVGHEDEDVSRGYTHSEMQQSATEMAKVPSV
jgi:integrase